MPHCWGDKAAPDVCVALAADMLLPPGPDGLRLAVFYSYFQSGSSGCFRSHKGRRLCTVGMVSKLYVGGGEVVAHSSVQASHGSSPATLPFQRDETRLYTSRAKLGTWMKTPS